jgi:heme-degrading monooxygenase HmoA
MIVRSWRAKARPGCVESYVAHARQAVFPHLRELKGFRRAQVMRRAVGSGVEIVVQTYWDSLDDIRAFAGSDIGVAVVEPEARAVLIEFDTAAHHYEIAAEEGEATRD